MEVKLGEHVFIAGRTGSGKTFLINSYLRNVSYPVFILDAKKTVDAGVGDGIIYIDRLEKINSIKDYTKVVYQPIWEELREEYFNEFFRFCYQHQNCHVWIDELMAIATSSKYPEYYKALMTRGRELNISVWNLTQRPKAIPLIAMSESKHIFIFDLNMLEDRMRLINITGMSDFLTRPGKFVFWYFNTHTNEIPQRGKLIKKGEI